MYKVLYHANCADGFGAAYLCWRVFRENAEYIPVNYGEKPPEFVGHDILIVDFSYPRDVLLEMKRLAASLYVLDHHKTAEAELRGLDFCKFDMTKCGMRLVEEWLGGMQLKLTNYIEDRDLWQWKLEGSREVSAAIASYPQDFSFWDGFQIKILKHEGEAILRYQKQLVERACKHAQVAVDGAMSVNSMMLQSEIGEHLSTAAPYVQIWYIGEDGRRYVSLRSRGEVDVSEIAKGFGGGGHKNAAGYVM